MNSLVTFWNSFSWEEGPPYIHPADVPAVKKEPNLFDAGRRTHEQFVKSDLFGAEDSRFHLSLLPSPYAGDLERAQVFVLMLNPGLGLSDYLADSDPNHSNWQRKMLRQDLGTTEFPFISLNPDFCWTGGFNWWEKKLRPVLQVIANEKFDGRYYEAMKFLSQRLASIELVPYHSRNFRAHKLISRLQSANSALDYVAGDLVPRALKGEIALIATRQAREWNLPKGYVHYNRIRSRSGARCLSQP